VSSSWTFIESKSGKGSNAKGNIVGELRETNQTTVSRICSGSRRNFTSSTRARELRGQQGLIALHIALHGLLSKRSPEGFKKASDYFQQDASYALAYVGLADTYLTLQGSGLENPQDATPQARKAAQLALKLDPCAEPSRARSCCFCVPGMIA
jgi:hypothetical protein